VGAVYFLEIFDFVNDIVMEAGLAKVKLMFTVAHEDLLVFLLALMDLSLANFAYGDVFELLKSVEETAAHHVADC
jgi:hypothetical protein